MEVTRPLVLVLAVKRNSRESKRLSTVKLTQSAYYIHVVYKLPYMLLY